MAKNKSKLIVLAVILLLFAVLSYFIGSRAPKEYPNYLSESPAPMGTKAVFTYLQNEIGEVERWNSSPNLLEKEDGQLLIMVEPFFMPESEETGQYREFMEAGNTILLFKTNPQGMFGLKTVQGGMDAEEIITLNDKQDEKRNALLPAPIRLDAADEDEVLISDEAGPVALERGVGEGSLIAATAPQWMTNDFILEEDHLPLVLSLINESSPRTILFDEYIHGGENDASVVTLYPKWFLLLMVQGLFLAILWLWYQGKRFGPVVQVREEHVRFSDERIKALAAWHLRGKRFTDSLNIQADYVKLLLQEKWGIPYSKDWTDSTGGLLRKWTSADEKDINRFVTELSDALEKETLSKQEYLLWSKKLDRLRKEVEEG
ncbi:DUF4350 domain-containing protein [Rossellomorea vietnamensis]|uniref:DUF4350 domain-containing protein n=1 Tax=Rossellomorea vietnamensis TaxID=218284 RepID=A0A5D4NWD7_9BACI|nr:DUF4350 domain-containing protein [Rossellomorea vietnamensis]TYS17794.1 DUF4350 domain-containing protein [Rossellomorea vietnamensis]